MNINKTIKRVTKLLRKKEWKILKHKIAETQA